MKRTPMTMRGAELLRDELQAAEDREDRPDVIKAIAEARAHGDLSENAEYHAAREQQGFIEGRISEIEAKLAQRRDHRPGSWSTTTARCVFGATVELEDAGRRQAVSLPDRRRGRGRHQVRPHLDHLADRARADRQGAGRRRRGAGPRRHQALRDHRRPLRVDRQPKMPCEECRVLSTHSFSSHSDLVNALQVAAGELDRGVLALVSAPDRTVPEQVGDSLGA